MPTRRLCPPPGSRAAHQTRTFRSYQKGSGIAARATGIEPDVGGKLSTDPVLAYAIDERIKQLGRTDQYLKELAKITRANKLPSEWATPEQRARAALRAVRNYPNSSKSGVFFFLSFVHGGTGGRGIAEFSTPGENGAKTVLGVESNLCYLV